MNSNVNSNTRNLSNQEKVLSLYKYLKEFSRLKQEVYHDLSKYEFTYALKDIPNDSENIKIYYRDKVDDDNEYSNTLLSIKNKPFIVCPSLDPILKNWLKVGYDNYKQEAIYKEFILRPLTDNADNDNLNEENAIKEFFTDNKERVATYNAWLKKREDWVLLQKQIEKTRLFFKKFYDLHTQLSRDSESYELIVADGFICDREDSSINNALLTHRIKIKFDDVNDVIFLEDADVSTELNLALLQDIKNINLSNLKAMEEELKDDGLHPLDRNDVSLFLERLTNQLSSDSLYIDNDNIKEAKNRARLIIYRNPYYILRKRINGTAKAVDKIIAKIEKTKSIPSAIVDIVSGGELKIDKQLKELSIDEQLAAVGGESIDILLSKEANKEQLEIARRIERYNAVVVQGPPGTGKTHTIANLMGHFLAKGKSILVTSHTPKALSVLKEKLESNLQNLCVSLLDDSNQDMEKSVDYISEFIVNNDATSIEGQITTLYKKREKVIQDLALTRKKLYKIIASECNSIVFNGEEISPSRAAYFVQKNSETLSKIIPGKVEANKPLPLTFSDLSELYLSNVKITKDDEKELINDLPNPNILISPEDFALNNDRLHEKSQKLKNIVTENKWSLENMDLNSDEDIVLSVNNCSLYDVDLDNVKKLEEHIKSYKDLENWMKDCVIDGKKGNSYIKPWLELIKNIKETCNYPNEFKNLNRIGQKVTILNTSPNFIDSITELLNIFKKDGKIGFFNKFNSKVKEALSGATVNGHEPQNVNDCALIIYEINIKNKRQQCASYWDNLIAKHDVKSFFNLDKIEPEHIAKNYIEDIKYFLTWYENKYKTLESLVYALGLDCEALFNFNRLDNDLTLLNKVFKATQSKIPEICKALYLIRDISNLKENIVPSINFLKGYQTITSNICTNLLKALNEGDIRLYSDAYLALTNTYSKIDLSIKRKTYLEKLYSVAPDWSDAIKNHIDIHGGVVVPKNIEDAWKWKQYYIIIEDLLSESFADLQKKCLDLSLEYRKLTAKYAANNAWYYLLKKIEKNSYIRQDLIGWKNTVKKIGKGTGKKAPMLQAEAQKLMAKCQKAIPAWIMPMSKALDFVDPASDGFDIVIIDEASQSDISALAILYMGKKFVIVGDDKQVSPSNVGMDAITISDLQKQYLGKDIPNAHLFDEKTSIYDVASTTYPSLMLKEHFRCVPEIINFSNYNFYDGKIKPLRDSSNSVLLPAVVEYRVLDGECTENNQNFQEAQTIVALIKACIEQEEYKGKTFGVITMLGSKQINAIQQEIDKHISKRDIKSRKICCGNSAQFQGDERDVIFLSLVHSSKKDGPLRMLGDANNQNSKSYNVATSRAREQLFVVHSIDAASDLKEGDLRKKLIDYAKNPKAFDKLYEQIEKKSESPFESTVAKYLTTLGYHLEQQKKVGSYRLDMVVSSNKNKVVIECDGERYHNDEDSIRADMERQTILERIGWQFIRIRGSEFYKNQKETMLNVINKLNEKGIKPSSNIITENNIKRDSLLLQKVKIRAHEILETQIKKATSLNDAVVAALDPNNDFMMTTVDTASKPLSLNKVSLDKDKSSVVGCTVQISSNVPKDTILQDKIISAPLKNNEVNKAHRDHILSKDLSSTNKVNTVTTKEQKHINSIVQNSIEPLAAKNTLSAKENSVLDATLNNKRASVISQANTNANISAKPQVKDGLVVVNKATQVNTNANIGAKPQVKDGLVVVNKATKVNTNTNISVKPQAKEGLVDVNKSSQLNVKVKNTINKKEDSVKTKTQKEKTIKSKSSTDDVSHLKSIFLENPFLKRPEFWYQLAHFAKVNDLFEPKERQGLVSFGKHLEAQGILDKDKTEQRLRLCSFALKKGFKFDPNRNKSKQNKDKKQIESTIRIEKVTSHQKDVDSFNDTLQKEQNEDIKKVATKTYEYWEQLYNWADSECTFAENERNVLKQIAISLKKGSAIKAAQAAMVIDLDHSARCMGFVFKK